MTTRRSFIKNLFGVTAASVVAARASRDVWLGREEYEKQHTRINVGKGNPTNAFQQFGGKNGTISTTAIIIDCSVPPIDTGLDFVTRPLGG